MQLPSQQAWFVPQHQTFCWAISRHPLDRAGCIAGLFRDASVFRGSSPPNPRPPDARTRRAASMQLRCAGWSLGPLAPGRCPHGGGSLPAGGTRAVGRAPLCCPVAPSVFFFGGRGPLYKLNKKKDAKRMPFLFLMATGHLRTPIRWLGLVVWTGNTEAPFGFECGSNPPTNPEGS